jgi:cytidyltransferase-like protein
MDASTSIETRPHTAASSQKSNRKKSPHHCFGENRNGQNMQSKIDTKTRIAVVTGCFDGLHSGHVRFLEVAASYGLLYVFLGDDDNITFLKGPGHPVFPAIERAYMVYAVRYVHVAKVVAGIGAMHAKEEILKLRAHYQQVRWIVNDDGNRSDKFRFCSEHGIDYIVLPRTPAPGIQPRSSTELNEHKSCGVNFAGDNDELVDDFAGPSF